MRSDFCLSSRHLKWTSIAISASLVIASHRSSEIGATRRNSTCFWLVVNKSRACIRLFFTDMDTKIYFVLNYSSASYSITIDVLDAGAEASRIVVHTRKKGVLLQCSSYKCQ